MNPYFAEIEYDDRARLNAVFEYPKYQAQNENAMTFADDPDTMIYMIDMNQENFPRRTKTVPQESVKALLPRL